MKNTKKASENPGRPRYFFFNLGCPKNLVDAETASAGLESRGWARAADPRLADLLVITTCAFIAEAEEESVEQILEVAAAREEGQLLAVIGCLVSREGRVLEDLLPEVDIFLDAGSMSEIGRIASEKRSGGSPAAGRKVGRAGRLFTPAHYAYLKLADGCSNRCTYCTIPSIRGGLRSAGADELLAEAAELADSGVKELILVAQDTTAWMTERGSGSDLPALIESLSDLEGIRWIRLMYVNPARVDAGALSRLFAGTSLVPYLDVPIQHVSDRVLDRMGRGYGRERIEDILGTLRCETPGVVIRTTVMTGFPGESEEDHAELVGFLDEWRIDHVGVFAWSPERGTAAAGLPGRLSRDVVQRRLDEITELQMDIAQEKLSSLEGEVLDVLVDRKVPPGRSGEREIWGEGRWYGQAPEIDGEVLLSGEQAEEGDMVAARVDTSGSYDLFATAVRDFN